MPESVDIGDAQVAKVRRMCSWYDMSFSTVVETAIDIMHDELAEQLRLALLETKTRAGRNGQA